MGIQTNDLEPGCLIRRSSLNPIEIQFPNADADGIALAAALGTAGTVQSIALSGVWPSFGGRLPLCMQVVAVSSVSTNTYSYRIVGEDWFGNAVDTGFVIKSANNLLGRSITRCFTKITSIEVNPTVFTPGDTISFGWMPGVDTDNCAFPLPFDRGFVQSADIVSTIPALHMLDHGDGVYEEYGGAVVTPGPLGQAGPLTGAVSISLQNGSFTSRMDTLVDNARFGKIGLHILSAAVRERY